MEKIDYLCVQILPPTPSGRRATLDYSSHHIMQEPLIPSEVEKDSPAYISVKELKEILLHANSEEGHGVRNIALTGPFGSGKSSILLTVQKEFAEEAKKFSRFSLFHWQPLRVQKIQRTQKITTHKKKPKKKRTSMFRLPNLLIEELSIVYFSSWYTESKRKMFPIPELNAFIPQSKFQPKNSFGYFYLP